MKIALTVALFSALVVAPLRAAESGLDVKPVIAKDSVSEKRILNPIVLRYVKPSLMEQWLQAREAVKGAPGKFGSDSYTLPDGLNNLIAVDHLNILLARGTSESIERLLEIVALLDKPVPLVQVDLQIFVLNAPVANLSSEKTNGNDSSSVAITRPSKGFDIESMIKDGVARRIFAQSVITPNNQLVKSSYNSETPAFERNEKGEVMVGGNRATKLEIETTIIPTVMRDGTLNLSLKPVFKTTRNDGNNKPQIKSQEINTMANIKDGDTLSIGGLRSSSDDSLGTNRDTEIVFLVSARVIPSEGATSEKAPTK